MTQENPTDFRFLAEPTDVNFSGTVYGGMVMKWIEQASYACAAQWSKRYCITGSISMHIYVVVRVSDPKRDAMEVTNRCFITFMAIDDAGYRVAVPKYPPRARKTGSWSRLQ